MASHHSQFDSNHTESIHLKVLLPSICGGAVIGKGGEGIVKAQKDTNTKVKISKPNEFFPSTTDRVCLIQGDKDNILNMIDYICDKIAETYDSQVISQNRERQRQTKIIIPNSSAGLLIGKDGETINDIKKSTGAFIQVSPKSTNNQFLERYVLIMGNSHQCHEATKRILDKVVEDSKLCSFPNINYGDIIPSNSYTVPDHYGVPIGVPSHNHGSSYDYSKYPYAENRNHGYYSTGGTSQFPISRSQTTSFLEMDFIASDSSHGISRTLEVDESYIGSILGAKGRSIVELQEVTDTIIKISKKPDSGEKSNKRSVTINGMYENVSRAFLLINDKIQLEQARRAMASNETDLSES